jgi:hypothetical protein
MTAITPVLKLLKQCLIDVTSCRLLKLHFCIILDQFCSDSLNNLGSVFQNLWVIKFMRQNS